MGLNHKPELVRIAVALNDIANAMRVANQLKEDELERQKTTDVPHSSAATPAAPGVEVGAGAGVREGEHGGFATVEGRRRLDKHGGENRGGDEIDPMTEADT